MIPEHKFVANEAVLSFFNSRSLRDREDLLRIWKGLAGNPYQRGQWLQRTASGRDLQVGRFGRWIVRWWLDEPALEVRIIDVERVVR